MSKNKINLISFTSPKKDEDSHHIAESYGENDGNPCAIIENAEERPSFHVTKTRPTYKNLEDVNNNYDELLTLSESILDHVPTLRSPVKMHEGTTKSSAASKSKSPNLNKIVISSSSKSKFGHVKSPVAEYIKGTPRTQPEILNVVAVSAADKVFPELIDLNEERPSIHVTKTRPKYNNNDDIDYTFDDDSFLNLLPSLRENIAKTPESSPLNMKVTSKLLKIPSRSKSTSPISDHHMLKIPSQSSANRPSSSLKKKFQHVTSPVADYINITPRPLLSQKAIINNNGSTSSNRFNFRDSIDVVQDQPPLVPSLPVRSHVQISRFKKTLEFNKQVSMMNNIAKVVRGCDEQTQFGNNSIIE